MKMSIKELKAKMDALQKEMKETGKAAVLEAFKEFFDTHPAVTAIAWTQYALTSMMGIPAL
jgi:hypothetical protein